MDQVLIALDQLINTLIGGFADETLSARAHRQALKGHVMQEKVIDMMFFWQPHHCKTAYESEMRRSQLPKEYR
jgi:hypothetical protein